MPRAWLSAEDGFADCASSEQVQIERRQGPGWLNVTTTQTDKAGRYTVELRDRAGAYRTRVSQDSVEGHTCLGATSPTAVRGN